MKDDAQGTDTKRKRCLYSNPVTLECEAKFTCHNFSRTKEKCKFDGMLFNDILEGKRKIADNEEPIFDYSLVKGKHGAYY